MSFSSLKKELDAVFNTILDKVATGEMPEMGDAQSFVRLITRIQTFADDDWADEYEDFAQLANQFLHAVKKQQLQDAIRLVESLNDAKSYCHRDFKM
ncbi:MAG: GAK system XXXCH domain-containing protein [Spirochaetaceae bacterium]|nr:MAG: GAK system XXXCH domain-containing protein [Spirochaetaceae bacterium]